MVLYNVMVQNCTYYRVIKTEPVSKLNTDLNLK